VEKIGERIIIKFFQQE